MYYNVNRPEYWFLYQFILPLILNHNPELSFSRFYNNFFWTHKIIFLSIIYFSFGKIYQFHKIFFYLFFWTIFLIFYIKFILRFFSILCFWFFVLFSKVLSFLIFKNKLIIIFLDFLIQFNFISDFFLEEAWLPSCCLRILLILIRKSFC
jgi:hypothetical protein